MIDPMRDSTLSVVPVKASIQRMPTRAPGTAAMMMKGSSHDWNSTTIRQYTRTIASSKPRPRLRNDAVITSPCPRTVMRIPGGNGPSAPMRRRMSRTTAPKSRPSTPAATSSTRCTV